MSEHHKRWADPTRFLDKRCRKPRHHEEWTGGETLYWHYRRWAFSTDREPMAVGSFYTTLNKRSGKHRRLINNRDIWPHWVKSTKRAAPPAPVLHSEPPSPIKRGQVRALCDQRFCDGLLVAGTELDWMEPTAGERHALDQEYQRQVKDGVARPQSWLIVVFQGKRRRVPADSVRKLV